MIKIVNLTPHAIVLRGSAGDTTVPPSGTIARVSSTPGVLTERTGIPVPVAGPTTFGDVTGLPAPEDGTIYIVSGLVAGRVARSDVFAPGTGPADNPVRDEKGNIVAVTRLIATV
jgi:hypothetical protein